jgi:hypothetical protein
MRKFTKQAGELHRYAGPREMYGFVALKAAQSDEFMFKSTMKWPPDMSAELYNGMVCKGIERALNEMKIVTGDFELVEVAFSDNNDANVPIAFEQASYESAKAILAKWDMVK